jgi:hypothetical protein
MKKILNPKPFFQFNSEEAVQMRLLSNLLPVNSVKWLLSFYGCIFFSIIGLGFSYSEEWIDKNLFFILLFTVTIGVCMYAIIGGIFLFAHKNPYLNEWKDKFGFHEK